MSTPNNRASTRASCAAATEHPCHLDQKATNAAARLLNGAGKVTVVCHDGTRGYTLDTAIHGIAADGRRYLVSAPSDDWPSLESHHCIRVAMTISTDTPIPEICMNTAELTGHTMLTRCSEDEKRELLTEDPSSSSVAQLLAAVPNAQLWHVEPLRMTIHHGHGSYVLDHEALKPRPAWPTPRAEIEAAEAMRCRWGTHLTEIVPHLKVAATVSAAFPDAPGSAHCATGRAYPVAVTDRDVWFLITEGAHRTTIAVPLPHPVCSVEALMHSLEGVVGAAA
ncbi:MAG: hypothetical protein Q4C81_00685 [Kocuria sp.]|nr:hypothetical protein [Kocuria sp.]